MDAASFYRTTGPSEWASSPKHWSFSSLHSFDECPRCWQLSNSRYGEELQRFPRRPNQQTAAGTITHDMLDRLFRALALRGLPAVGSAPFRAVLARVDLLGAIRAALEKYEEDLVHHPRGAGFRLRISERDLYNQVCKLFQSEYAQARSAGNFEDVPTVGEEAPAQEHAGGWLSLLKERKVLTEVSVEHPTLPVKGIIDLLARQGDATRLVDFKTGAEKADHRAQLELYALLWYRSTGDLPASIEVRYPAKRAVFPVVRKELEKLEAQLEKRIETTLEILQAKPAKARVGAHCKLCDVRQYCDDYWASLPPIVVERGSLRLRAGTYDLELIATSEGLANGLRAKTRTGAELPIVFDADGLVLHGPFAPGDRLRILKASVTSEQELRLVRSSEVFHSV